MKALSNAWQMLFLVGGTLTAYFLTVILANIFIPERGCLSIRGLLWGIVYTVFFAVTAGRLMAVRDVTLRIILRNFLICAITPYLLLRLMILFQ